MSLATLEEQQDDRTAAEVLNTLSLLYMFIHDHANARSHQARAIEIYRKLSLPARVADCLANDIEQENDEEARRLYIESMETFRKLGNSRGVARLMRNLGFLSYRAGDHRKFKLLLDESVILLRGTGDLHLLSHHLNYLGDVSRCDGSLEAARQWYGESRNYSTESGFKGELAWALTGLGFVSLECGETSQAEQLLLQALDIRIAEGSKRGIAQCLAGLSSIMCIRGDPEGAARMLGAIDAALSAHPGLFLPVDKRELARSHATVQETLAPDSFSRLLEEGRQISLAEAVALFPGSDLFGRLQLKEKPEVR